MYKEHQWNTRWWILRHFFVLTKHWCHLWSIADDDGDDDEDDGKER